MARANPQESPREKTKIINATEALISVTLSIEAKEQLERLKDVLSQKERRAVSLKEAIEYAAQFTLERVDPLKKAERSVSMVSSLVERNVAKTIPAVTLSSRKNPTRTIPANIKHQVLVRDKGRCTLMVHGRRCETRRWLDLHHIRPISKGGSNELKNLTTLCASHHKMLHAPDVMLLLE